MFRPKRSIDWTTSVTSPGCRGEVQIAAKSEPALVVARFDKNVPRSDVQPTMQLQLAQCSAALKQRQTVVIGQAREKRQD